MPNQFQIDIKTLLSLTDQDWGTIRGSLKQNTESLLTPNDIRERLSKAGLPEPGAGALARLVITIAANVRQQKRTPEAVLRSISDDLSEDERASLKLRETDVLELADGSKWVAKALHLAYDHRRILRNLKVYLDLRPIFDDQEAPEKIFGFISGFTVRFHYLQDDEEFSLDMMADLSDLIAMKNDIERAIVKLKIMKTYVSEPQPSEMITLGEGDDNKS